MRQRTEGNSLVDLSLLALVFGIVFVAELPDKTALASLVLGTRYRPVSVFVGVAVAFALHVVIAVAAGSVLSLSPPRITTAVVAVLFLAAAALMLRRVRRDRAARSGPDPAATTTTATIVTAGEREDPDLGGAQAGGAVAVQTRSRTEAAPRAAGFWKVAATSFGVVFVAEFGDLTQIATANLAAQHHAPLTVALGATLGLWAVGGLAILGGRQLLRWIPIAALTRIAAAVMAVLGVLSAVEAILG